MTASLERANGAFVQELTPPDIEMARARPVSSTARRPIYRSAVAAFLFALVLLIVAMPFLQDLDNAALIEGVLLTLVLVAGVRAVGARRGTHLMALILVLPALLGKWGHHFWPELVPREIQLVAALVFLAFVVMHLLRFILRAPRVNPDVLCAGIATYLVLGLAWTMAYLLVARLIPKAFVVYAGAPAAGGAMDTFTALYFSFVTLTTTGYGDIIPAARVARMLAIVEAMTGMFYVSMLIARLVSLYSSEALVEGDVGSDRVE